MNRFCRSAAVAACLGMAALGLPRVASAQTLTVNAGSTGQTLNGLAWGINVLGWSNTSHANMATFNELGMKTVRYPAGSPGDHDNYLTNTTLPYPWTQFCSDMSAAGVQGKYMIINLNYGTGTPQDAADWVRDANINRHMGIKYWELGNEVYTPGQDSHGDPGYRPGRKNDALTYASEYKAWRDAMRAVDPTIKLGAVGQSIRQWGGSPYGDTCVNPVTGQTMNDWQSLMLNKMGQLGITPDFLIQHHYMYGSFNETDAGLLAGVDQFGYDLPTIVTSQDRADINAFIPNPSQVEILGTEFGFIWDAPGKISTNLPGALYMARRLGDTINTEMKMLNWYCFDDSDTPPPNTNGSQVNLSASLYGWRNYGQWGIESSQGVPFDRHPEFYVTKLLNKFVGDGDVVLGCTSSQANLKVYSVKHTNGTASVLVVNIAPTTDYNNVPINLTGISATGNATVWTYGKANDTAAQNGQAGQDLTQTSQAVSGSTITRSYPQYSVTLITFNQGSNTTGPVKINAGGPAASPFIADTDFSGGTAATNWTGAIDTTAVTSPAPQAVYQSERYGAMTYTMGGLTNGATYTVRLHFCENFFTTSGSRTFTVAINGANVLTNFDIFAASGAIHKANVQQFNAIANASGQIVVSFTNVVNNALVNGIEVNAVIQPQAQIASGTATIDGSNADAVWSAATSYNMNNVGGTVSSSADLSGSWKGAWDATNLYVLVDVTDDVKINESVNAWDDDAVEVFVDGGNNKATTYDANDRQYVYGWGDAAVVEPGGRSTTGVTFAKVDPTGTTYRIETKIPWSTLGVTAAANNLIGIDVQADDDDDNGARDGYKTWNDTTGQGWTNPSVFGTGKLVAGGTPPAAPSGLTAVPGNAAVALAWNASSGATSYNVLRSTVSGGGYASVATGVATTSYTNTGLTNGTQYYFVVQAVSSGGTSGNGNQAAAKPVLAPAFVQVNSNNPVSAQSIPVAYSSAQTAGNLNIVVVGWNDTTSAVSSVTDSLGNTYTLAVGPTTGGGQRQSIYYARNIKGGSNTVTVAMSTTVNYPDIRVLEYTGLTALDVTAGAFGTSAAPNSGNATTTTARELIFTANTCYPSTTAVGAGFTTRVTTIDGDIAADKSVTATGAYNGSATLSASNFWVMQMAAFK
jgi:hypothetical protein